MGNLLVIVILLAVAVGLYFLSRFAVTKTHGANWGGFVLSLGIISATIGLLMIVSTIATAVGSGRINNLTVEVKGDLNQSIDLIKQVNDKLNSSVAIAEAVTFLNDTRSSFDKKNAVFFSKLKEANLNIDQWNAFAGSLVATIDSLETVKGEFTNAVAAYSSKAKGIPAEIADFTAAAGELNKAVISFWDQLRIVGFKKTSEK